MSNIYQKLLKIQQTVSGLGKDTQGHGYQYVSGSKILGVIKPLMNENKLLLKQEILSVENVRQDYQVKSGAKSEILSKIMMQFTWVDSETGEKDVNLFAANGQNGFDKGLGSALTYAERYFLLKYFHIATDEDDIDSLDKGDAQPLPIFEVVNQQIDEAKTIKDLTTIFDNNPHLHSNNEFVKSLSKKKLLIK